MTRIIRSVVLGFVGLVGLLSIIASGGGGGGGFAPSVPTKTLDGMWTGTLQSNISDQTQAIVAITNNGRMILISRQSNVIYDGDVLVDSKAATFSTDLRAYNAGGASFATLTFSGTFAERVNIEGTYTSTSGDTGTITLNFNAQYDRGSSLTLTQGIWTETAGTYVNTITANADGSFFGSDTDSCSYTGNVTIIDPDFAVYGLNMDVSTCSLLDGAYTGFAFLSDSISQNDTLNLVATNDTFGFLFTMARQ
jgi:hypothetical protein